MAPMGSRKRIKPSPSNTESQSTTSLSGETISSSAGNQRLNSQRQGGGNWYPALWPAVSKSSKAAPVTEVARESISAAKNVAPSIIKPSDPIFKPPKQHRHPSLQLTKREGVSTRSLPADATTTKINIASDGSTSSPTLDSQLDSAGSATNLSGKEETSDEIAVTAADQNKGQPQPTTETSAPDTVTEAGETSQTQAPPNPAAGWFSWFYTSTAVVDTLSGPDPAPTPEIESTQTEPITAAQTPKDSEDTSGDQVAETPNDPLPNTESAAPSQKRTWFQMWYGSSAPSQGSEPPKPESPDSNQHSESNESNEPPPAAEEPVHDAEPTVVASGPEHAECGSTNGQSNTAVKNARSSGWSFWFRDTSHSSVQEPSPDVQSVEVPPVQDISCKGLQNEPHAEAKVEQKAEPAKKGTVKIKTPKSSAAATDTIPSDSQTLPDALTSKPPEAAASKHLQRVLPNQVLPHFSDTFAIKETPSLLQTIGRFLHYQKGTDSKYVHRIRDPPRIKRALAIGVHGYFPAPLIRSVLGQPTGTSVRFATMAAAAIHKWTESHGYACEIEKIALEGEGRIAERVDLLWKLLLNWMEEIRKADFILIACHSQGVPVAIMLVAKLIAFGCLNASRVGICAMAGVNMGPFSDYRSRWISGSAGELFEFALPYSQVSKDYEAALRCALNFGVRISYVGSIDDQLVSLESSLFSPVIHPYIYRAVFVDGRVHAPSFLSHLVGFVLKLRNLGISDHGLIRELSSPLAGSLYSGEGHSRLYDDEAVYRLAIEFALETSSVNGASLDIRRSHPSQPANPYILPFAMRGLLEEEYVRRELYEETMQLLRQFDDWKPASKVLKDVKFRLEGIRSKL
ncbi:uncharacterized protein ACLA_015110 [Aspergillus clavatus NRRL 1]|uniref:YMC020W-like alpha/beta hydrolase domain-containing protein n=1 Tax=Aspergillus clavatus (strain ATCC 1007 / CBS 513.65 / DSM 816 / NCTC 3887 / NRRL 1 / QM 1276 / 107) TaxID=344612 RepID=A1CBF5_ASPCL|nr:uncharacterized protein ACLA_015110 [Aspergillus clavatus NRRL 1]EAW13073.1 conserved hypothetical protein [Aspergillus clavatus NRRL 1]